MYQLAKQLNRIIKPYVSSTYSLRSTEEFIDIIKANKPSSVIASLDVESLFTNVPVARTIGIILNYVYDSTDIKPLKLPRNILKRMLEICTAEAPFRCPQGKLYVQKDGVAMGSPLGVLFAEAFMAHIEATVITPHNKPKIYCRYIDDIFISAADNDSI